MLMDVSLQEPPVSAPGDQERDFQVPPDYSYRPDRAGGAEEKIDFGLGA